MTTPGSELVGRVVNFLGEHQEPDPQPAHGPTHDADADPDPDSDADDESDPDATAHADATADHASASGDEALASDTSPDAGVIPVWADADASAIPLSAATLYDLLANERRRRVLDALAALRTPVRVGDLARCVGRAEANRDGHLPENQSLSRSDYKATYAALHQCHLPLLVEHGLITWDQETGAVSPTSTCYHLLALHNAVRAHVDPHTDTGDETGTDAEHSGGDHDG